MAKLSAARDPKITPQHSVTKKKSAPGNGPKAEFVIEQVDGTTATFKGKKDAISTLAFAHVVAYRFCQTMDTTLRSN